MKKLSITVTTNNETKIIYVLVDDETAKMLEQVDEQTRHDYLLGEHEIYLNNLKERRRHQSLESSIENGYDFASEEPSLEEKSIEREKYGLLHKAISTLSKDQKWLIREVYFKGRSNTDIASELGVTEGSIRHRLERIYKKIKKIFI